MNRNELIWVMECCLLSLDGVTKKDMLNFGCSEELAELGIKLYSYLINKEIVMEIENG